MSRTGKPFSIIKLLLSLVLVAVLFVVGAFLALTLTEYKPADIEAVEPAGELSSEGKTAAAGQSMTIVSFNTGYAALGEDADFFMDGGKTSKPENSDVVNTNMQGIAGILSGLDADIYMLQEVDIDSARSFGIDEAGFYCMELGLPYLYALNYSAKFVPYPVSDMIGKVNSGLATYTGYGVAEASRIQLPIPFSWPVRCFNLKRCLLVSRLPLEGSDRELVIVNLHLEAYDDGEGKIAQTAMLYNFLEDEYAKGNYVIAGGDFNQTFPGAYSYPALTEGCWMPGTLDPNLPEGFSVVFCEGDNPTCRLLDVPYKGNDNPQYYIIDGYLVSSNVRVDSVEVIDCGFKYSDHQPVRLEVTLAD